MYPQYVNANPKITEGSSQDRQMTGLGGSRALTKVSDSQKEEDAGKEARLLLLLPSSEEIT